MVDARSFLKEIKQHPDRFYIIHYSSEHLFDENIAGGTPRITSVVVSHFSTGQLQSFAIHTAADTLGIPRANIAAQYDAIEREMLRQFYEFMATRTQNYWVHWNMRSIVFGFEHLAHRYQTLTGGNPVAPDVPIGHRINLNDVLRAKYGELYADHPQLLNLMKLQGDLPMHFLTGEQESACFANQDFIRMHLSTISKVQFFSYVIKQAIRGKLKTISKDFVNRIDRLLESRVARVVAFGVTALSVGSWAVYFLFKIAALF
jgi:hypothetical protein